MPIRLKIRVRKCDDKARIWLLARVGEKPTTDECLAFGEISQAMAEQVLKVAKDGYLLETEIGPDLPPEEKSA